MPPGGGNPITLYLPDPTGAYELGSVDPPKTTHVSLAAMGERAQPLQGTPPSWRAKVRSCGCRRFTDGILAHVRTPGGPTGPTQPLLRVSRPPSIPCLCPSSIRSNRRGTDPYARWCGRGGVARRSICIATTMSRRFYDNNTLDRLFLVQTPLVFAPSGRFVMLHGRPLASNAAELRFNPERNTPFSSFRPRSASKKR